jgi:hypothetical protein
MNVSAKLIERFSIHTRCIFCHRPNLNPQSLQRQVRGIESFIPSNTSKRYHSVGDI